MRQQDQGVGGVEADSNYIEIEFSHKLIGYWAEGGKGTDSLTVAVRLGPVHLLSYQYLFLRVLSRFPAGAKDLPRLGFR